MNQLWHWTGAQALRLILACAAVSVLGIVGMLLTDATWDWLLLLLAASPLALGAKLTRVVERNGGAGARGFGSGNNEPDA